MSELHVRNIANDIQLAHQIHLSGETWDKIRQGVNGAILKDRETQQFYVDMYKRLYEELNEDKPYVVMNETIQYLKREIHKQPKFAEAFSFVLFKIYEIKKGKSVR